MRDFSDLCAILGVYAYFCGFMSEFIGLWAFAAFYA